MIKGTVEVINCDTGRQVFPQKNLTVDGFGSLICDILTLPIGVSGVASSVFDTSNYSIQAISFGKALSGYQFNAHEVVPGNSLVYRVANPFSIPVVGNTSSYINTPYLAEPPTPIDVIISGKERFNINQYSIQTTSASILSFSLSSLISSVVPTAVSAALGNGQNLNFLAYENSLGAIGSSIASFLGSYPPKLGMNFYIVSSVSSAFPGFLIEASSVITSGSYSSTLNAASAIDVSGFIRKISSGPTSGLVVSGHTATVATFLQNPLVDFTIILSPGDVGCNQLFGGIQTMGLWGIDVKATLKTTYPPFDWINASGISPRQHKLVAKKVFTDNIVKIADNGSSAGASNYSALLIRWRLDFNMS